MLGLRIAALRIPASGLLPQHPATATNTTVRGGTWGPGGQSAVRVRGAGNLKCTCAAQGGLMLRAPLLVWANHTAAELSVPVGGSGPRGASLGELAFRYGTEVRAACCVHLAIPCGSAGTAGGSW